MWSGRRFLFRANMKAVEIHSHKGETKIVKSIEGKAFFHLETKLKNE